MAIPKSESQVSEGISARAIDHPLRDQLISQIKEVNKIYLDQGQLAPVVNYTNDAGEKPYEDEEVVLSLFDGRVLAAADAEIAGDGELVPHLDRKTQYTREFDLIQLIARLAWNRWDRALISDQFALSTMLAASAVFFLELFLGHAGFLSVAVGVAIFAVAGYYVDSASRTRALSGSRLSRRHKLHLTLIPFFLFAIGLFAGYFRWEELTSGYVEFRNVHFHDVSWFLWTMSVATIALLFVVLIGLQRWNIKRLSAAKDRADSNVINVGRAIDPKINTCDEAIKARLAILLVAAVQQEMADLQIRQSDNWALTVPVYETDLVWSNLSEHYAAYIEIPELKELSDDVDGLHRAAIGIAGERGAGKTALMNALRRSADGKKYLTVWIAAPTAYDEREFLLSVLARLAVRAGIKLTDDPMWPSKLPEKELEDGRRLRNLLRGALFASVAVVAGVSVSSIATEIKGLIGGALAMAWASWLLLPVLTPKHLFNNHPERNRRFLRATHTVLNDLWFEQKQSTSSSISMGGLGIGLGGGMAEERTRRPFTVPQLVQLWDDYVHYLTTGFVQIDEEQTRADTEDGYFPRIVIFIDEVDKIKDEGGAGDSKDRIGEFIRILKALYRPSKLFFFVSISEDAYDRYRLHSVGRAGRDEFDSAFDKMKKLELMTYEDTRRLLNNRIADVFGLPEPVIQLVWILSKGNPRDSIRLAREILQDFQGVSLSEVTKQLLRRHHLDDLRDQYQSILKNKLAPNELFEGIRTVDSVESMLVNPPSRAEKVLAPLNRQIASHTNSHNQNGRKGSKSDDAILDLSHLRASLYYALTISHTFRESWGSARFQSLKTEHWLAELGAARILQEKDGLPDQALLSIDSFRQKFGLNVLSTNSVGAKAAKFPPDLKTLG